jgi:hypothetical protein
VLKKLEFQKRYLLLHPPTCVFSAFTGFSDKKISNSRLIGVKLKRKPEFCVYTRFSYRLYRCFFMGESLESWDLLEKTHPSTFYDSFLSFLVINFSRKIANDLSLTITDSKIFGMIFIRTEMKSFKTLGNSTIPPL